MGAVAGGLTGGVGETKESRGRHALTATAQATTNATHDRSHGIGPSLLIGCPARHGGNMRGGVGEVLGKLLEFHGIEITGTNQAGLMLSASRSLSSN